MGKMWYTDNYRRNLVDMHIEEWDESFMASFDPETYVDMLKKANVTCAMVYANSHVGLCYWPTESGKMHPGLKGRDIFGEVVKLCHEAGMDVILYYTLIYDNWAYEQDPEWRILRADGRHSREVEGKPRKSFNSGRYGVCCPNSQGYRDYTRTQLKELADRYQFESVFFDMTFWPDVCYCNNCKRRYEKEVGGQMPRIINWNDPVWNRFQEKREEWLNEYAHFATNTIKEFKPGVTVNHQYSSITTNWVRGVNEKHKNACDYAGGDFYAGLPEQSFICKMFYSMTGSYEFHTTRCTDLSDHTTCKSEGELVQQASIALAHNGAFLFIDAIDPQGTLNPDVYEKLGRVFKENEKYEKYLGGKMCQDAAVLFDMNSKMSYKDNGKPVLETSSEIPHLDAAVGAARILKEAHIPYGVIGEDNLKTEIEQYKAIILPDVMRFSKEASENIREYVKGGGCVYASGHTDLSCLEDVFGLKKIGETTEEFTYIAPVGRGKELIPAANEKYPMMVKNTQILVETEEDTEVLGLTVLPYTNPSDFKKFASIHSNPPGIKTGNPAITVHTYGKGKAIWVAAPIEAMGREIHDQAFATIIHELVQEQSFELEAPPAVEAVEFYQEDKDRYLISLINLQELTPVVPVHNMKLTVDLKGKTCERAVVLPDELPVEYSQENGKVTIKVPELDMLRMLLIETK